MTARYLVGDVFDRMAELDDGTVDLILTSPPFLALRSYLPADHPDKGRELGSEPTPAAFIDMLLALTVEWRRLLAPHGSLCVELGDTYAGSTADGGDNRGSSRYPAGRSFVKGQRNRATGWPLDKSLCLIPELYRIALVYGLNPLTGQPSPAGTWRARNVIRWCRPNPPVGALGDKVRPATSDMVVACVSGKRYFDLDAVRHTTARHASDVAANKTRHGEFGPDASRNHNHGKTDYANAGNPAGAPPLDHWWYDDVFEQDAWLIPTAPYKGSHYATWPPELCVKPIRAMCPEKVCVTCGEPSRRITSDVEYVQSRNGGKPAVLDQREGTQVDPMARQWATPGRGDNGVTRVTTTVGWTDCGHGDFRPGLVLDPFAGSGTTLAVATGLGRHAIGIDLDARNADLARERVGMFLTIEDAPEAVA